MSWKILPEDYNYYGGGGGNGAMVAMMQMQMEQARQDREAERVRQEIAEQKALENARLAEEKAAKEKSEKITQTGQKVQTAYDTALSQGRKRLINKGIDPDNDPYGIMSLFTGGLDSARAGLPEIVENANGLFSSTLLDDALTEARGTQRSNFGRSVKNTFGDNYGLSSFADTADDPFIEAILNSQKADAVTALDRALARGTLNEVGRTAADKELGNMYKTGLGKANSLGMNVLNDYRSQLDSAVGKVRDRVSNWDFGDQFNIDNEFNTVRGLKDSLSGRLEGDIMSVLDGMSFFDNDLLLGKGGNASGINNAPNPLATAPGGIANSPLAPKNDPLQNRKTDNELEVF